MGFWLHNLTSVLILFVSVGGSNTCRVFLIEAYHFSVHLKKLIQPLLSIHYTSGAMLGPEIEK